MIELIISRYNYWVAIILLVMGLHGVVTKKNLLKKIVSLSIFQTSIMLFYVSIGVKYAGKIPIISHKIIEANKAIAVDSYANPLPHVLMLTAIVVGVGTTGVALSILERLYEEFGSIEEDEIIEELNGGS